MFRAISKHRVRSGIVLTAICLAGAGVATAYALQSGPSSTVTAADSPNPLIRNLAANPNTPADKRDALNAHAQAVANAIANPPAVPTVPPNTTPPSRTTGIDNSGNAGPFSYADFAVSNSYQGPVGSTWYLVFAGETKPLSHGAGALEIYSGPVDLSQGQPAHLVGEFPFPDSTNLTISSVSGSVLTLQDATGATHTFDLANMPSPPITAATTTSTTLVP